MRKIKKLCTGILSLAVLGASLTINSSAVLLGDLGGDVNNDGVVDRNDAFVLFNYVTGYGQPQINYYNSDVNTDGYVNEEDFLILFDHLDGFDYKGDVNNDGQVNSTDLTLVNRFINGQILSYFHYFNADIDNDGYVTNLDRDLLKQIILHN